MLVDDIMTRDVVTVALDTSLAEVREIFQTHKFHHVLVIERGKAVGVLSDRDLLKHISPFIGKMAERPQDLFSLEKRAHQVMTRKLISVPPGTDVCTAAEHLAEHRVGCLPIIDERGRAVGIVSLRDLLRTLAAIVGCSFTDKTDEPEHPEEPGTQAA